MTSAIVNSQGISTGALAWAPQVITGPTLLLDVYTNSAFGYSFRKLRAAYAGSAVRIRRNTDNAELDIGFDVTGNFDAAAAATFIGGGTGFITTWYDQSANGLDVTQPTAGSQPYYAASGIGGLPCASFIHAELRYVNRASVANTALYTGPGTTLMAVMLNSSADNLQSNLFSWNVLSPYTNAATFYCPFSDNTLYYDFGDSTGAGRVSVAQPVGWKNNPHIVELYGDSGGTQAIVADGNSLVSAGSHTTALTSDTQTLAIGMAGPPPFAGYISEIVLWKADLGSTNRAAARNSINSYYSVF